MIYRQVGSFRQRITQYWQKRYELWKLDWAMANVIDAYPPLSLFDAKTDHFDWKLSDDRVLGGFSSADLTNIDDQYLRWKGTLDTTVGLQSKMHRSGYCAIYHDNFMNLQGNYSHLEVVCRAVPSRTFTMNVTVETSIPEDLFQGELRFEHAIEPNEAPSMSELCSILNDMEFESFVLPFRSLRLTARGRSRHVRRILDDRIALERLGFILKDKMDGDFVMDIQKIRAVNLNETGIVGDEPLQQTVQSQDEEKKEEDPKSTSLSSMPQ